ILSVIFSGGSASLTVFCCRWARYRGSSFVTSGSSFRAPRPPASKASRGVIALCASPKSRAAW
ncbi:hypothetical protein B0T26DRAFT_731197, partial [Lasiosphaeria miniovina]